MSFALSMNKELGLMNIEYHYYIQSDHMHVIANDVMLIQQSA